MDIRGRNKITPEFNMSSMTDVVFLLLIFFMIASTLVSAEAIDVLLPKSTSKTTQTKNVSVTIDKKAQFYVDTKRVSKSKLESELLNKLGNVPNPSITIRGDKKIVYEELIYVLDIAYKNKIKPVLAVKSK